MSDAKSRILNKLKAANATLLPEPSVKDYYQEMSPSWQNSIERLRHWSKTMRSVKTEVIWVTPTNWQDALVNVAKDKNIQSIVLPNATSHGDVAAKALQEQMPLIKQSVFSQKIEDWKDDLFANVDAGFTDVKAGIAQTGTLLMWPDPKQPRSMSLVPPIHIALFDTSTLHNDFYSAMQSLNMADNMPSNVVLVSGPSKTADIQLTLAYGAHGPRDLVVLAVLPENISANDIETSQEEVLQ